MIKILNVLFVALVLLSVFLISCFETKLGAEKSKKLLLASTVGLSIFLGIRSIGLDLEPYRVLFRQSTIVSLDSGFTRQLFANKIEPFFVVLMSLLKSQGLGFNAFLFVSGIVPMYLIYKIIAKAENWRPAATYFIFLSLYLFRGPIDIVRHFFAAAIYLSSLYSLSLGSRIGFWGKCLFSTFVHYSNVSTLLVFPFVRMRWSRARYGLLLLLAAAGGLIGRHLLSSAGGVSAIAYDNFVIWKLVYYLTYYNRGGYQYQGALHKLLLFSMDSFVVLFNAIFIFLALSRCRMKRRDDFRRIILASQITGSLLGVFFIALGAPTLGLRLQFLFGIGNFLLVKEVLFSPCTKDVKTSYALAMLTLMLYNFIIVLYHAGIHNPNSPFYIS